MAAAVRQSSRSTVSLIGGKSTYVRMSGFRGGVNYYRNFQRNWEITENLSGAKIQVPTTFIAGEHDETILGATAATLRQMMAPATEDLRDVILIPNMGHWIQQEAPDKVNDIIVNFLKTF